MSALEQLQMQMHQRFDSVDQRFQEFQAQMNLMESRLDAYSFQPFSAPTPPPPQPSPPSPPAPNSTHSFFENVPDIPPT